MISKDSFRLFLLVAIASGLGVWSIINTVITSQDSLAWVDWARQIRSAESASGTLGVTGQKYLFWPQYGGDYESGNAGMGVSAGINGITVFEHAENYMPALAVYREKLGKSWNHIVIIYTHKQPHIFLNGHLVREGLLSQKKNVFAPRKMGGESRGFFKGSVRDVQIWGRPLNDREVQVAALGKTIEEGAIGIWKFDEGTGTTAYDSSGNEHHATIRGAQWVFSEERYSLHFNGSGDTVELNFPATANNYTIAAWIRTEEEHEIKSMATKILGIPDPGFSFMIVCWHWVLSRFGLGNGNLDWMLAGQTMTLLCRLLSLIPLFFIGKCLVGSRQTFWALLVLIFLPWPAEWGHDVLREWPHLLFLSGGLFMVLRTFESGRVFYLLLAGMIAGLGHTIRPECAQIIIYAFSGLVFVLFCPTVLMSRQKAALGVILLGLGFAIIFLPYVHLRGQVLPKKLGELLTSCQSVSAAGSIPAVESSAVSLAGFATVPSPTGLINLIQHLAENQYYYFFPFMLIGLYQFFCRPRKIPFEKFFMTTFIIINILMLTALHHNWGYISRRHVLPLTAMTVFFVPLGVNAVVWLLNRRNQNLNGALAKKKQMHLFLILIMAGILLCLPKLLKPLGSKIGFRKTADYLRLHTPADTVIAVPDTRIAFYAERNGITYEDQPSSGSWDYLVSLEDEVSDMSAMEKVYSHPLRLDRHSGQVVVYRRIQASK